MKRKILIIGGPRSGKTTLANKLRDSLHLPVVHFDSHIKDYEWSELSEKISEWLDDEGPWIKEGVSGVRGLRKWLRKNPEKLPDFEIHIMNEPKVEMTPGQARMHKAHSKILQECMDEIKSRKERANK